MIHYKEYKKRILDFTGIRKKYDTTIYSFDIETTSYLVLDNKQIPACDYLKMSEEDQKLCKKASCMYIWMLGIDSEVYFGRTWKEFHDFINILNEEEPSYIKYIFVHNLAFEFQYLKNIFEFEDVNARKSHKVIQAKIKDMNIIFKCTYFMSNNSLAYLPQMYNLPVEKKVGELDYSKIRHSKTFLTEKELGYCEYDCLVIYYYIKEELKNYHELKKIPNTSTGKVRRELKELVQTDMKYKRIVNKAINVDPHIYNLLVECFSGGYTHANWIYTDEILEDVDSYDETSAYPYVLVTHKFPSSEFKKISIKNIKELSERFCYILVVKFKHLRSKFFNNIISASKCRKIRGAKYDNGRISECEECEMVLTDVDFRLICDWYTGIYNIEECYYANKSYLPKVFINFVLDKYVLKTELKNVKDKELEYMKEKNKFNSLYGMSVTNLIRSNVIYNNETKLWEEKELTNDEILDKLWEEKKKSFLSFSYGVWVTAYARDKLLRRVMELDEYVIYCDTDSIKLKKGYNKKIIDNYNKSVIEKIDYVSDILGISKERYEPEDIKGIKHLLGIFELETEKGKKYTYDYFITQGAKKYAYQNDNEIHITVAGVPKSGAKGLKSLKDFKDDFVFEYEYTNKNILYYCENQEPFQLVDYLDFKEEVNDISGCCILPTTYVLSKGLEYVNFITDESSKRSIYKEGEKNE